MELSFFYFGHLIIQLTGCLCNLIIPQENLLLLFICYLCIVSQHKTRLFNFRPTDSGLNKQLKPDIMIMTRYEVKILISNREVHK